MAASSKTRRLISGTAFLLYLMILLYFLFFDQNLGRNAVGEFRYNLVPFREIHRYIVYADYFDWKLVLVNLGGNILAFIPLGYFLPRIFNLRIGLKGTTLLCFAFSLLVELIQLFTQVGSFDIDDVILNTIGGFAGYIICRAIQGRRTDGRG